MRKIALNLLWLLIAVAGAWAYVTLALHNHEPLNSVYILIAALCSYTIGYRFYSKWVAAKVLTLNERRATPCEVHEDGKDFVKTNKWIVFGHHFSAISGPGPLVGPVLAAQFGYLPSTLWILIGVVLGGAVQDFVVLFCSIRRDGKSLGQMVKEELNSAAGFISLLAILAIMVILLAVLALVIVRTLAESPWGVFTVGATIPIALFIGGYLRFWRIGKVMEASVLGALLLLLAVWGGKLVHESPQLSSWLSLRAGTIACSLILYGLAASILPVWLLLAPRGYISTFTKLGVIFLLALGIFFVLPDLKMPAISQFVNGTGLVVPGKIFPFCFITIACGSISGFHTLIASGTTPKMITRESYSRSIGYGAMLLESLVAIMALIAACTLDTGVYLSMNVKGEPAAIVQKVTALGYPVTVDEMSKLANQVGEKSLFSRMGGAATLAVGMAQIFSKAVNGRWLDLWYHFAIMFEALFILTTLDAGTRVGRYLLQDMLGGLWRPLGDTKSFGANLLASTLMVAAWGYFLIQGVLDPLGGINSLWPLFGIANQLLSVIALCLATTVILKMQLRSGAAVTTPEAKPGKPLLAGVTLLPLVWLLAVTMTAGVQKIWSSDPVIGFLAQAKALNEKYPALEQALTAVKAAGNTAAITNAENAVHANRMGHFNNLLDAFVTGGFLLLVAAIVFLSVREWLLLLARRKLAALQESEPVWLPDYALVEAKPLHVLGLIALAFALAKELSGEAEIERAQRAAALCECAHPEHAADPASALHSPKTPGQRYAAAAESRYRGVRQCC